MKFWAFHLILISNRFLCGGFLLLWYSRPDINQSCQQPWISHAVAFHLRTLCTIPWLEMLSASACCTLTLSAEGSPMPAHSTLVHLHSRSDIFVTFICTHIPHAVILVIICSQCVVIVNCFLSLCTLSFTHTHACTHTCVCTCILIYSRTPLAIILAIISWQCVSEWTVFSYSALSVWQTMGTQQLTLPQPLLSSLWTEKMPPPSTLDPILLLCQKLIQLAVYSLQHRLWNCLLLWWDVHSVCLCMCECVCCVVCILWVYIYVLCFSAFIFQTLMDCCDITEQDNNKFSVLLCWTVSNGISSYVGVFLLNTFVHLTTGNFWTPCCSSNTFIMVFLVQSKAYHRCTLSCLWQGIYIENQYFKSENYQIKF